MARSTLLTLAGPLAGLGGFGALSVLGFGGWPAMAAASCLGLVVEAAAQRAARANDARAHAKDLAALKAETDRLVGELSQLKARLQKMAESFDARDVERSQRLKREMRVIEALVEKLAAGVAKERGAIAPKADSDAGGPESEPPKAPPEGASTLSSLSESELLEVIRSALEDNRIDLYLQPIVDLPQRRVRFYEGLSRLRSLDGEVIEPAQYMRIAEPAGLVPIIDNLLLFRCVQIVRRLLRRQTKRGVFCNVSLHSLTDREFFPQFLEFVGENRALADLLIFEFSAETLAACGEEGEDNLEKLAALGFHFSLDNVTSLKLDFGWLRRRGFRYVKVPVETLLAEEPDVPREIVIANFLLMLGRQGIEMIAERIEDERAVLALLEHEVKLAQGFLFGRPKPIRRDLIEDERETRAA